MQSSHVMGLHCVKINIKAQVYSLVSLPLLFQVAVLNGVDVQSSLQAFVFSQNTQTVGCRHCSANNFTPNFHKVVPTGPPAVQIRAMYGSL